MYIYKNGNRQITTNFTEDEFFSKSYNAPVFHFLDDNLINAVQWLRSYLGQPIKINSTYRTKEDNPGVTNSQHLTGKAIDFKTDNLQLIVNDIAEKGVIFQKLFNQFGIRGFGLYNNFIHIDTRTTGGKQQYNGINYAFWNERTIISKIFPIASDEDGIQDSPNISGLFAFVGVPVPLHQSLFYALLLVVLCVLALLLYHYRKQIKKYAVQLGK